MPNYKVILFDLDGTLLDTSEGILDSVRHTVVSLGFAPLTEKEYQQFLGPPIKKSLMYWFQLHGAEADCAVDHFRNHYKSVNLFKAKIYDGTIETLEALKNNNIRIGIATYKRADYAKEILQHFDILPYCDIVVGDTAKSTRTKAQIIDLAVSHFKDIDKNNILMVGDSQGDADGASDAGVDFCGVTFGFGFRQSDNPFKCKYIVDDLPSILSFIRPGRDENVTNKIIIGADKLGYDLKQAIIERLEENNIEAEDVGCNNGNDDTYYPLFAERVCEKLISSDKNTRGILICGTGLGMSIVANKFKGIAAAICHDAYSCERSILSNNANVLCLGARIIDTQIALEIVEKWLTFKFVNGRSTPKLALINEIESRNFKS